MRTMSLTLVKARSSSLIKHDCKPGSLYFLENVRVIHYLQYWHFTGQMTAMIQDYILLVSNILIEDIYVSLPNLKSGFDELFFFKTGNQYKYWQVVDWAFINASKHCIKLYIPTHTVQHQRWYG